MNKGRKKKDYYRSKIQNLRKNKPRNWHKELKKLTSYDQQFSEEIIKDLPISEQAERIADKFAAVSQEFEKLATDDIKIPNFSEEDIPQFDEDDIEGVLESMDTSKSNVAGDIPAKILKTFAVEFKKPITEIINTSIRQGRWPDILKMEMVTPVPNGYLRRVWISLQISVG